jgi:hypothetical protein
MVDREDNHNPKWWPFILFFVVIISGIIVLIVVKDDTNLRAPEAPENGCIIMKDNGNYGGSINIIFLGTEYEDLEEFRGDSDKFMNSFLDVTPHDKYKDRFNFFRIEEFSDFGCKYDDAVVCDPKQVSEESTKCPGQDVSVVLVSRNKAENFFKHLRSSAWMSLISLNSADDPLVLPHEAAHIIYDFADEYVYGGKITWDAPNCDSEESCPKFSVVEGSECIVGCVNEEYSRPAEFDIMSNYWKSDRYEVYNEWYIENLILETTSSNGDSFDVPIDVYIVEGDCSSSGDCTIRDVRKSPDRYPTSSKFIDSRIEVRHGDFSVKIPSSPILFKDYGPSGSVELRPYSFSVSVPVSEENEIVLIQDNIIKAVYNLKDGSSRSSLGSKIVNIPEVS